MFRHRLAERTPCREPSDEFGSTAVEAVIVVPVAMVVLLFAVQACLWAHAETLVQAAATAGAQTASALGGSPSAGAMEAREVLVTTASRVVIDPSVATHELAGASVEVEVSGSTEAVVPWLHLHVSAVRVGTIQEFRESG